ncbi:MAG TPA: tetratricopeptide repeat protein [Thermoanaerobaculia bacterium]|nr:tetratricopeptide repeat protein [Thermoanaerobaculia bacterium]
MSSSDLAPDEPHATAPAAGPSARFAAELAWLLPALIAAVVVFLGSIHGDFVYDDGRQIVRNTLIQDPDRTLEALGSDVWAAVRGTGVASNYWRPTFVGWLIVNVRLFGLEDTTGWHLASVALHLVAVGALFALARALGASRPIAAAVALLFAVHPVHAESVAWISGSPDLLLAVALLGAAALIPLLTRRRSLPAWAGALALFVLALGAKETALTFPVVVFAVAWTAADAGAGRGARARRALWVSAPFALLSLAWLGARTAVLGAIARPWPGAPDLVSTLLTAPAVFAFYLRQSIWPVEIGPSYPLRAVAPGQLDAERFWIPLLVTVAALAVAVALARRVRGGWAALILWLAPLAPTFALGSLHPEQLVHDRYLYLPVGGFLLLTISALALTIERAGLESRRASVATAAIAALLAILLAARCHRAAADWTSEEALWTRGVATDPTSAFNHLQLGATLEAAGRLDEAKEAIDRSLELERTPRAYLTRARILLGQGRFQQAEADLQELFRGGADGLTNPYTLYQAFEALAIGYDRQGRPDRAAAVLASARGALPMYSAAITDKRAVALYRAGRKAEALSELESQREAARRQSLPESRNVLFHLGMLYAELQRGEEARAAFRDYLEATEGLADPRTLETRARVQRALEGSSG